MSKAKLVEYVVGSADGITKKQAEQVVDLVGDAIHHLLKEEGEATLPGVGKLKLKERPARTGRNPKTGEAIKVAAKTTVKFSSAKTLNDAINR